MNRPTKPDPQRQLRQSKKQKLEDTFLNTWKTLVSHMPMPEREYVFHPTRKWRFDFAWPSILVAVEIDRGAFTGGGHGRGSQQAKDYDKMNAATSLGWRVLRFNTAHMKHPHIMAEQVEKVICGVSL